MRSEELGVEVGHLPVANVDGSPGRFLCAAQVLNEAVPHLAVAGIEIAGELEPLLPSEPLEERLDFLKRRSRRRRAKEKDQDAVGVRGGVRVGAGDGVEDGEGGPRGYLAHGC